MARVSSKRTMRDLQLVIFDCDGVLVDSEVHLKTNCSPAR